MYLVVVSFPDNFLCFLHCFEDVRLSISVPVSSDAQVYFVSAFILLEGLGCSEDGVWGRHCHVGEDVARNWLNLKVQLIESVHGVLRHKDLFIHFMIHAILKVDIVFINMKGIDSLGLNCFSFAGLNKFISHERTK